MLDYIGDNEGECRAHGNLGSACFSRGNYREALTNHRCQLSLAMKLKLKETAAAALSNLGHVYTAVGDYPNALASHKQCVLLVKQCRDKLWEAREIGASQSTPSPHRQADRALIDRLASISLS